MGWRFDTDDIFRDVMSQGNLVIAVRSDAADDEVTAAAHPDDMATCLGMHHMTRPAEVPRGESSALTETDPTALLIWCSHRGSRQAPLIPMTSCQAMSTGASARRRPARVVVEPLVERVFGPSQPELHPPPLMVSPLLVLRLLARSDRSRKVEHYVSQLDLELRFKVITPGVLCVLGTVTGSRKPLMPDTAS